LKTYPIKVQRLKSPQYDHGIIEMGIDAMALPRLSRADAATRGSVYVPVDHTCSLLMLLKQRQAALDKPNSRSQRSGRA